MKSKTPTDVVHSSIVKTVRNLKSLEYNPENKVPNPGKINSEPIEKVKVDESTRLGANDEFSSLVRKETDTKLKPLKVRRKSTKEDQIFCRTMKSNNFVKKLLDEKNVERYKEALVIMIKNDKELQELLSELTVTNYIKFVGKYLFEDFFFTTKFEKTLIETRNDRDKKEIFLKKELKRVVLELHTELLIANKLSRIENLFIIKETQLSDFS